MIRKGKTRHEQESILWSIWRTVCGGVADEYFRELDAAFEEAIRDPEFLEQYHYYLKQYVGRETPLYYAERLSEKYGMKIYLKREDLNHTGAHKINNVIGQILLAKRMGKKR